MAKLSKSKGAGTSRMQQMIGNGLPTPLAPVKTAEKDVEKEEKSTDEEVKEAKEASSTVNEAKAAPKEAPKAESKEDSVQKEAVITEPEKKVTENGKRKPGRPRLSDINFNPDGEQIMSVTVKIPASLHRYVSLKAALANVSKAEYIQAVLREDYNNNREAFGEFAKLSGV